MASQTKQKAPDYSPDYYAGKWQAAQKIYKAALCAMSGRLDALEAEYREDPSRRKSPDWGWLRARPTDLDWVNREDIRYAFAHMGKAVEDLGDPVVTKIYRVIVFSHAVMNAGFEGLLYLIKTQYTPEHAGRLPKCVYPSDAQEYEDTAV